MRRRGVEFATITHAAISLFSYPKGKNPTREDIPKDKIGDYVDSYGFK